VEMMKNKDIENEFGLNSKYLKMIIDVLSKYSKIEKALIYGSRAKGNYTEGSDIDIAIVAPELNFSEYLKIMDDIEQIDVPNKIDLTQYELLDESIQEHIKRIGKEIYIKN
jgi:predicted nucleotidyltransferase